MAYASFSQFLAALEKAGELERIRTPVETDLVIAEWSHSGALRFWLASNKAAPQFHKPAYVGQELRRASMEVRIGDFMRDAIRHDKNGSWTTWARRTIEHHTGIRT